MDCNACSTKVLLHWMKDESNKTLNQEKLKLLLDRFRFVIFKFGLTFVTPQQGFNIRLGDNTNLFVNASLMVCNLQQRVSATHREIARAWGLQWNSMVQELQVQWDSGALPLQTVVQYVLTAVRLRREQAKPSWKGQNANLLGAIRDGLVNFLAYVAELTVNQDHAPFEGRAVPASRMSRPWLTYLFLGLRFQLFVVVAKTIVG